MLSAHNFSYTRSQLLVIVGLIILFGVAITPGSPSTTVDQSAAQQNISDEHTLVIKTTADPIQYTLSATGRVTGDQNEKDAVQGGTLTGRVGGVPWNNTSNDPTDTVTYTGSIETFQHSGNAPQLQIEGQKISPAMLSSNHLQIVRPNASNGSPISYEISVTGDATRGESTENQEQISSPAETNNTRIQGQLTDQYDSFYFTGNVTVTSSDQQALVFVNGQNTTVQNEATGTPTATPVTPIGGSATATPATTTTEHTTTQTATDNSGTESTQTATDNSGTESTQTATDNSGTESTQTAPGGDETEPTESTSVFGFLSRIASGLILVALIVVVIWYLLPKQQRW